MFACIFDLFLTCFQGGARNLFLTYSLIFLSFFVLRKKKKKPRKTTPKKQGFSFCAEPLKSIPGKEGKNTQKVQGNSLQGNSLQRKTQGNPKKQGRSGFLSYPNSSGDLGAVWEGTEILSLKLGFPRPQTGARIPIFWKGRFRAPKTPTSPRPYKVWKREFSAQKSPFPWDLFDRKLPFQNEGKWGFLDPDRVHTKGVMQPHAS